MKLAEPVSVDKSCCPFLVVTGRLRRHWLATSCSRNSANFSRAAATFSGRCSVGHRPGAGLYRFSTWRAMRHLVHFGRSVDETHDGRATSTCPRGASRS